ncbi:MAG: hypothetical protein JXA42_13805 [Anaerolineales bacterium]|nr:hypothetical protein [Anaerolineales bacterium]
MLIIFGILVTVIFVDFLLVKGGSPPKVDTGSGFQAMPSATFTWEPDGSLKDVSAAQEMCSHMAPINFNDYTITPYDSQDGPHTMIIEDGGLTLHLQVNAWKKIEFPYQVDSETFLEFEFRSDGAGEIQAIGAPPGINYTFWFKACHSFSCSAFSAYDSGFRPVFIYLPVIYQFTNLPIYQSTNLPIHHSTIIPAIT